MGHAPGSGHASDEASGAAARPTPHRMACAAIASPVFNRDLSSIREPRPAPRVEDEREDDLAEPLADAVRLPGHGRAEDVGPQDLAVVEHPLPAREVPVRVRIARRESDGEREAGRGEADRERVASQPAHRMLTHDENALSGNTG